MSSDENPSSMQDTKTAEAEPSNPASIPSSSADEGHMLESMETLSPIIPGEVVRGKVLSVTDSEVLVDIGLKSEAALPREEFLAPDGQLVIAVGDSVDLWVERYDEAAGTISVSRRKAALARAWDEIERAFNEQTTICGRVTDRIKGGLTVDIGLPAFLPGSHADMRPHANLDALKGQEITCKVIKVNKKRNNAVVSRKLALEEEASKRKARLLERLAEGAELEGRIKNLTDYGAFVDLGGMDGLLHITDLSWGRVAHPSEVVQVGQEIKVKVLKFDREKERISLGLKQLSPDPWEHVQATYHPGDRVKGRVVSTTDYGAFVELEPGIEGLIHISEMTWGKRLRHPSKIVNVGDLAEVVVLDVSSGQRRIALSLRQTLPDPWATLAERVTPNVVVEGKVRNLTDFGAFIEVEDGVDGLIHLSNLAWGSVKHPSEILRKGQRIRAMVLGLDAANRRLSLGLKQLQPDVWEEFFAKTKVSDVVRGKVARQVAFGSFVELPGGIEGLCHTSEYGESARGKPEVGAELDFCVIRLNPEERKIGLSLKNVPQSSTSEPAAEAREGGEKLKAKAATASAESASSLTSVPAELQPAARGDESSSKSSSADANPDLVKHET